MAYLLKLLAPAGILAAGELLKLPATIVAAIIALGALVTAVETIWRRVLKPPLELVSLVHQELVGSEDEPSLRQQFSRLTDRVDRMDRKLNVIASEDRLRVVEALEAAKDRRSAPRRHRRA